MTELEPGTDAVLAGELALGLLEGEALLAARVRRANDAGFAARVAWWESNLAPLLDSVGDAEPDPALWDRIATKLAAQGMADGGEVVALQRRIRRWQGATALALAASLAAMFVAIAPLLRAPDASTEATEPMSAPPLVAAIPIGDTSLRLAVTFLPERREVLIDAAGLRADGVHDHELWLVDARGQLQSLGVVRPGAAIRTALTGTAATDIRAGSRMVLTREPIGGKPPGTAAGPTVAQGRFAST